MTKTKRKYYPEIDLLKAFAALLVVLIHVINNYTYISDTYYIAWDLMHFSVGAFVFTSGFLMANSTIKDRTPFGIVKLLWKKYKRIVVPYYPFAVLYLGTLILVDGWDIVSSKFSFEYLVNTVLVYGGVEYDWIPRLFMTLSIIYLIAELIKPRFKYIYSLLTIAALSITLFFLTNSSSVLPLFQNIPGWFLIFMTGYIFQKKYSIFKKVATKTILIATGIMAGTYIYLDTLSESISIIGNKYPPNLYFVAYNILLVVITLIVLKALARLIVTSKKASAITKFYSFTSYDMFFYHLIVLKLLGGTRLGLWWDYFIAILLTTFVIYVKRSIESKVNKILSRRNTTSGK